MFQHHRVVKSGIHILLDIGYVKNYRQLQIFHTKKQVNYFDTNVSATFKYCT